MSSSRAKYQAASKSRGLSKTEFVLLGELRSAKAVTVKESRPRTYRAAMRLVSLGLAVETGSFEVISFSSRPLQGAAFGGGAVHLKLTRLGMAAAATQL